MFGHFLSYRQDRHQIELQYSEQVLRLQFFSDRMFRVFSPLKRDVFFSRAIDLLPTVDSNLLLHLERVDASAPIKAKIKTRALIIHVFDEGKLDIYDLHGTLLCADYRESRAPFVRRGNSELAKEEGHAVIEEARQYKLELIKQMNGDECFYGLGERPGHLNKRGCFYRNWNTDDPSPHAENYEALYKSIPFFMTLTKKSAFGIFFDNSYQTYFDFGKENHNYYYFAANDGNLDYYFIYGPAANDVITQYTQLTGTTPLPQKWTLGYQQCRWSYPTATRVREIATTFRERQIPCDVIYLDIDYMDGYRVFTWNQETFPDPAGLIRELNDQGFKVVTIIDPGVKKDRGYTVYEEGLANGYFATDADGVPYVNRVWPGDSLYPDFTEQAVRDWWGQLHDDLLNLGIAGIWTDMNEPASFNGPLPDDVQFKNDGYPTDHREAHNVYGSLMARATFDGIRKSTGKRPFVITRACYAGTQKYSTIWTGDNHSFWEHLRMSIPMLCNLGVSGMSFIGTDVGGFSFDCTGELLSRWVQVGAFTPLFRNHSAANTRDQEPWAFDATTEQINRKYIQLRYRLIPYLYDQLWHGETTGLPLIRPLFLDNQQDEQTYEINDQFMCGDSLLVAPVVQQAQTWRQVYLPSGEWFDYWQKQVHQGGQYILVHAPLDVCPLFVKAGAVLANDVPQQFIGENEHETLVLDIYPNKRGNQSIYEHIQDDGESYEYQSGGLNVWRIESKTNEEGTIHLAINQTAMGYSNPYKHLTCHFNISHVKRIVCNGGELVYEQINNQTLVTIEMISGENYDIEVYS